MKLNYKSEVKWNSSKDWSLFFLSRKEVLYTSCWHFAKTSWLLSQGCFKLIQNVIKWYKIWKCPIHWKYLFFFRCREISLLKINTRSELLQRTETCRNSQSKKRCIMMTMIDEQIEWKLREGSNGFLVLNMSPKSHSYGNSIKLSKVKTACLWSSS